MTKKETLNLQSLYNILVKTDKDFHDSLKSLSTEHANDDYVYLNRGKDNKILFVAHTDTVRGKENYPIQLQKTSDNKLLNAKGILGADDRTGCFLILEMLKNNIQGFDVLFTSGEEVGGVGVKAFIDVCGTFIDLKDKYNLFVELDRQGFYNFVQYGDANSILNKDLSIILPKHKSAYGSYSDVLDLSEYSGVDHINLAVGYVKQHSNAEYQDLDYLQVVYNDCLNLIKVSKTKQYIYSNEVSVSEVNYFNDYFDDDDDFITRKTEVDVCYCCGNALRGVEKSFGFCSVCAENLLDVVGYV